MLVAGEGGGGSGGVAEMPVLAGRPGTSVAQQRCQCAGDRGGGSGSIEDGGREVVVVQQKCWW